MQVLTTLPKTQVKQIIKRITSISNQPTKQPKQQSTKPINPATNEQTAKYEIWLRCFVTAACRAANISMPTSQSPKEQTNRLAANKWTNQPTNQPTNRPTDQPTKTKCDECFEIHVDTVQQLPAMQPRESSRANISSSNTKIAERHDTHTKNTNA